MILLSKQWLRLFKSMKFDLEMTYCWSPCKLISIPPGSAIAHHISDAGNITSALLSPPIGPELLFRLATLLPNAKKVVFGNKRSSEFMPSDRQYSLPPLLETFGTFLNQVILCPPLITALSATTHLRSLKLDMELELPQSRKAPFRDIASYIDFTPLQSLTQLDFLHLQFRAWKWSVEDENDAARLVAPSLATFLRSTSLVKFWLYIPSNEKTGIFLSKVFEQVTADPQCPLLQAKSLTSPNFSCATWTLSLLQAMTKFSQVTELSLDQIKLQADDLSMLSQLPHLTSLELDGGVYGPPGQMAAPLTCDAIVVACRSSPNLLQLLLTGVEMTDHHFDTCMLYLPHLTSLKFKGEGVTSLTPLTKYGLPNRLSSLDFLSWRTPLTAKNLKDTILHLQQVKQLDVRVAVTGQPISEKNLQEEFQHAMPNLESCEIRFLEDEND